MNQVQGNFLTVTEQGAEIKEWMKDHSANASTDSKKTTTDKGAPSVPKSQQQCVYIHIVCLWQ